MKKKVLDFIIERGIIISILTAILFLFLTGIAFQNSLSAFPLIALCIIVGSITGLIVFISIDGIKERIATEQWIIEARQELSAAVGINKLTKLPLKLGGWAITGQFLQYLVEEIYLREPQLIVECGSGTSTIVTAACLKDIGKGKVLSLDHEPYFAKKTRKLLAVEGTEEFAQVVTAPIKTYDIKGESWKWYGIDFEELINSPIDILVVDGPPSTLQSRSRYPAVAVLKKYLAEDCLILLDDGERQDEKTIAKKWADELNVDLELDEKSRGFWKIKRKI